MYIIQIADLHIGSEHNTEPAEDKLIEESIVEIKKNIPKKSEILLCICGDIIDSNNLGEEEHEKAKERYDKAKEYIQECITLLEDDYQVTVRCCPGNHDITHEEEFLGFVKNIDQELVISKNKLKSCYSYELKEEKTYCVFVNSCDGGEHKFGKIDYDGLERKLDGLPRNSNKILVLHHTIMSMFDEDISPIRNAAKLVDLVDKYKVVGILHGHIHGKEILMIGRNQCKVIGTGALFTRNNPNVNSQFNIIEYSERKFQNGLNIRYNADSGSGRWSVHDIEGMSQKNHHFVGESFGEIYEQLINRLNTVSTLDNVRIEIETGYTGFKESLSEYLKDDCLRIGDREYDYFQLAEMWEADEVPKDLYFNHGSCFKSEGTTGIEFVAEQLKKKPTSNRIILPTGDIKKVVRSLDDSIYLPSLVSIQFGKFEEKDQLIVHMNLRALEAKRFLKINICEILYILEKLKEKSVQFNNVKIIITAFRVQKRERFNCFLKARIDDMDQVNLAVKVSYGEIEDLCTLLKEKIDGMETITKIQGIQTVYKAMKATNDRATGKEDRVYYEKEILRILEDVLDVYRKLNDIHQSSSIQTQEEIECESNIAFLLKNLIKQLQEYNLERKGLDG